MTPSSAVLALPENSFLPGDPAPRLWGRWLVVARMVWGVVVLIALGVMITGLPDYAHQLHTICTSPTRATCNWGQLTSAQTIALHHIGWSLGGYLFYTLAWAVASSLVYVVVGALIFWHKSAERMGLFVSLLLLTYGLFGPNAAYLEAIYLRSQYSSPLIVIPGLIYLLQRPALGMLFCTFPDGHLVPRWSWLLAIPFALEGALVLLPAPYNLSSWPHPLQDLEWVCVYGSVLGAQVYRYFRVASPIQRQQIKWLAFVAVLSFLVTNTINLLPQILPALNPLGTLYPPLDPILVTLPTLPVPIGIGIALLRYRLWDIDALINKALVYGLLTAILGALYVGLIIGLESLVSAITNQASQPLALVISTLAIAALFVPVRRRLQALIDRRFYRRKYDAEQTLAAFSAQLRNEVDLEQIRAHILSVVQGTTQPAHVSLWLRVPGGQSRPEAPWFPIEDRKEGAD